jgi:hypothetical protein
VGALRNLTISCSVADEELIKGSDTDGVGVANEGCGRPPRMEADAVLIEELT